MQCRKSGCCFRGGEGAGMSWLYLSGTMESRPPGWIGTVSALQTGQGLKFCLGGSSSAGAEDAVSRAMMSSLGVSLFEVASVFDRVRWFEIC